MSVVQLLLDYNADVNACDKVCRGSFSPGWDLKMSTFVAGKVDCLDEIFSEWS